MATTSIGPARSSTQPDLRTRRAMERIAAGLLYANLRYSKGWLLIKNGGQPVLGDLSDDEITIFAKTGTP